MHIYTYYTIIIPTYYSVFKSEFPKYLVASIYRTESYDTTFLLHICIQINAFRSIQVFQGIYEQNFTEPKCMMEHVFFGSIPEPTQSLVLDILRLYKFRTIANYL